MRAFLEQLSTISVFRMACGGENSIEGYFSVVPKRDCPHVEVVNKTENLKLDLSSPCLDCQVVGENWVCLICSEVHCSRYINSHMVEHNQRTQHAITLSFTDLSFWCYECDSYISSPLLKGISKAAEMAKFQP